MSNQVTSGPAKLIIKKKTFEHVVRRQLFRICLENKRREHFSATIYDVVLTKVDCEKIANLGVSLLIRCFQK